MGEMSEGPKPDDSEARRKRKRGGERGPRIKMPSLECLVEQRSQEIRRSHTGVVVDPYEMLKIVMKESCCGDPAEVTSEICQIEALVEGHPDGDEPKR